jgi:cobalt-zinc-cadmium efflux system membrane fusion protein
MKTSFIAYTTYSRIVFLSFALLTGLLFNGCGSSPEAPVKSEDTQSSPEEVTLTDAQLKQAGIQLSQVKKVRIGGVVHLKGKSEIAADQEITVSAPFGGVVRQIKWMPGMQIQKGQIVATMENKEYIDLQQDYLSARSAHHFAELDLKRQKSLVATQATSEKQYLQAEQLVASQHIQMKALEQKLRLAGISVASLNEETISSTIQVLAPASGYVSEVFANTGMFIDPSKPILNMVDPRRTFLVLKAFEQDMMHVQIGDRILAHVNNNPLEQKEGKIAYIGKTVADEGFTEVVCHMAAPTGWLPGVYVGAAIETSASEVPALPEKALVYFEGQQHVFVQVADKTFRMQKVNVGLTEEGQTEILNASDLEGKQVVVEGAYTLLMALKNTPE